MTNPESQDPTPRQDDSSPPPEKRSSGKPERSRSGNLSWYIFIGIAAILLTVTFFNPTNSSEKLKYSEFVEGIKSKDEIYTKNNVHNLVIGRQTYIQFQDAEDSEDTKAPAPKRYYIPIMGIPEQTISQLTELLDAKGIVFEAESPPSHWQSIMFMLLPLVLIFILFIFMFRRMGGAGSAMSFGRSRGRFYAQEDLNVTFDDAAGIDEAANELREVVEFLRTPAKYQALGGRIPRGVLLVGPPGTGKTLLAKAVAGEAGVPFFSLSGSDFVEMFVGVGASRVRDMFAQATAKSPAIIFIDELDALGKVRGSGIQGGHDEREQTLNALLVEMDGFNSDQSVIVMAATNRPETLDPALLRPGRFDRQVLVDRPDFRGREAILKVHIVKIKLGEDVDLERIARMTPGFVGADLANLVNEAALLAARNNKTVVTSEEFEEGIERVVAGLEKHTRIISPDEKQRVAYHECGHALAACSLPHTDPVHKISIIPRGMSALGYTMQHPDEERHLVTQSELQNRICVLLGGIVTEEIVYQETSTGAQNDLERATDLARRMVTEFGMSPKMGRVNYQISNRSPFLEAGFPGGADRAHSEETIREIDLEIKRIVDEANSTVHDIINEHRKVLEHMTKDLLEREVMDADQLQVILDEHQIGPRIKPGTHAAAQPGPAKPEGDTQSPPTTAEGG